MLPVRPCHQTFDILKLKSDYMNLEVYPEGGIQPFTFPINLKYLVSHFLQSDLQNNDTCSCEPAAHTQMV